jgi:hypothetical protein
MAQQSVLPNSFSKPMATEQLVLERLQEERSFTVEELLDELPELSWSQVFLTIDLLSRRGSIELRREGFTYTARAAKRPLNGTEGLIIWSDVS